MTHLDFYKKSKPSNPLEALLRLLGFVLVTFLFICCFFYLHYRAVHYRGVPLLGEQIGEESSSSSSLSISSESASETVYVNHGLGFLDEGGESCDISNGSWVWDDNYPLYQSQDCAFLDNGFRCLQNGRPDNLFTKWRWQPKDCDLPRFNATKMLEMLRNRRLAFIGDSIGRNQWESMLCILSSAVPNKDTIYEINGQPITKHKGFLVFRFEDYNCTVEYYRAPFLVVQGSAPRGAPEGVRMTLKLDKVSWTHLMWKDADVLVFNTGHWWSYGKTIKQGCYFQEGTEIKMSMNVTTAFRKSIETLADFVEKQINTSKTQVYFRSYAPAHFRGGTWKSGGHCHQLTLPDFIPLPNKTEKHVEIVSSVLSASSKGAQAVKIINITPMTYLRPDGHISLYHYGEKEGPGPMNHQDCSHWCLPGVPDSWNELLYAFFLKQESLRSQSLTELSQTPTSGGIRS